MNTRSSNELAALAQRGALSDFERIELNRHLGFVTPCQEAYEEYALISAEGMPFLAATLDPTMPAKTGMIVRFEMSLWLVFRMRIRTPHHSV